MPGVSIIASNSVDEAAEDANPDAASPIVSKKELSTMKGCENLVN